MQSCVNKKMARQMMQLALGEWVSIQPLQGSEFGERRWDRARERVLGEIQKSRVVEAAQVRNRARARIVS